MTEIIVNETVIIIILSQNGFYFVIGAIEQETPTNVKVSLSLPKFPTAPTLVCMKMSVKGFCYLLE